MNFIRTLLITILMLSVASLGSGCAITPVINDPEAPRFNGNDETSGIVQDFPDHSSEITAGARERYNNLILSRTGLLDFLARRDFGISPLPNGNYLITAEGKEYWYSLKLDEQQDLLTK